MKILGISGSPVKGGNNEKAIDYALTRAKSQGFETEKITLAEKEIKSCTACDQCKEKKGTCSINDYMETIRPKLVEADAIIISSPVYFGTLSGQLKCMFDRTLPLRRDSFKLKDKIGAAIAIGRSRNGGQEYTIQTIHIWMHIQGMLVVGDNNHFGGTIVAPFEEDVVGKKTIDDTVDKVCELLKKIKK
ncbi:MAG: flavodoxin family protein [Nanoarchaeota archaeon]|nr:flavodoxin family protein [Nanoarchaeota archaeon]MBU1005424.1 flavodoxin family protein [Nanoarchaeota archaeon]MBU1945569.1 flavodoxin family protein [Nanoarchaeota archaeon]